jgi:hypothetical protein
MTYRHIKTGALVTIEHKTETTVYIDWFQNRRKNALSNTWTVKGFNEAFEAI